MTRAVSERAYEAHQAVYGRKPLVAPQAALDLGLRSLAFTLPYPPSVNSLYGIGTNGTKYLLPEQRRFRTEVITIVRAQMRNDEPLHGWLRMTVMLYPPDGRLRDGSNALKALEDALQHARAFVNDYQIDQHEIIRVRSDLRGECRVTLSEIAA